jgi:dihydroorotase
MQSATTITSTQQFTRILTKNNNLKLSLNQVFSPKFKSEVKTVAVDIFSKEVEFIRTTEEELEEVYSFKRKLGAGY